MKYLTKEKRYDMIDVFNATSRYLNDLLNIDNINFEQMVYRIHLSNVLTDHLSILAYI